MSLLGKFKRALTMPPHVVLGKVVTKVVTRRREERERKRDSLHPTYAPASPKGRRELTPRILDLSKALTLLPAQAVLEKSRRILAHEFDLLGSGWVQVKHGLRCAGLEGALFAPGERVNADSEGRWLLHRINEKNLPESRRIWDLIEQNYEPIDWQLDFKSGYRWSEATMSRDIAYGSVRGQDVKVPWELARMQHLPALAWAYGLSQQKSAGFGDPAVYTREFRNQILDFIATNPPRYGVNWSCTMDVGIRIANWVLAYDLFRSLGATFDPPFEESLARSVYEHALHIRHHLEWDPLLRSNHYLADIAGLIFATFHLQGDPETAPWIDFAAKELEKEVESQFHQDGSNFEASTSYHRLSTEMALYASSLFWGDGPRAAKRGGLVEALWNGLKKAGEFTRTFIRPDGRMVQTGDNDSGRFFKVVPLEENSLDHRHLLAALDGLFDRVEFKSASQGFEAEGELVRQLARGAEIRTGGLRSKVSFSEMFPDFGLYRLIRNPWWLCVRCGSVGQKGNGGHAHNDQLSFELCVDGKACLVDPGTYVYTPLPGQRNKFRSTAMHNTLSLNGLEQNPFGPELFRLKDKARAKVIEFKDGLFIGEHKGFGPVHRRTLRLEAEGLTGLDECRGKGIKAIYFHAAPGWEAQVLPDGRSRLTQGPNAVQLTSGDGQWSVEEGLYSSEYGKNQPAQVLVLKSEADKITWKIQVVVK